MRVAMSFRVGADGEGAVIAATGAVQRSNERVRRHLRREDT
jgi:hypothetical protein